jgi:Holliday junction resolvase RusA-like endonuclease
MTLSINLHLAPKPTPRPRFVTRGKFVSTYYPKDYVAYTDALRGLIEDELNGAAPFDRPVTVLINITLARPKTTKLDLPKPDVDNYAKGILDAMTKAGVWTDDSLVSDLIVSKRWGEEDLIGIGVAISEDFLL